MDIEAYLQRIAYEGPRTPDAATLRALQRAHLLAVPFENLDISLGRPIALDEAALFTKIITRRRGGICYELNGLFATLLRSLGFQVTYLSASDSHADGTYGPDFDHLALLVPTTDAARVITNWLVDVGWGDTFCTPLALGTPEPQSDGVRHYRLEQDGPCMSSGRSATTEPGRRIIVSQHSRTPSATLRRCARSTRLQRPRRGRSSGCVRA